MNLDDEGDRSSRRRKAVEYLRPDRLIKRLDVLLTICKYFSAVPAHGFHCEFIFNSQRLHTP